MSAKKKDDMTDTEFDDRHARKNGEEKSRSR